jgi:hypothetical protein
MHVARATIERHPSPLHRQHPGSNRVLPPGVQETNDRVHRLGFALRTSYPEDIGIQRLLCELNRLRQLPLGFVELGQLIQRNDKAGGQLLLPWEHPGLIHSGQEVTAIQQYGLCKERGAFAGSRSMLGTGQQFLELLNIRRDSRTDTEVVTVSRKNRPRRDAGRFELRAEA